MELEKFFKENTHIALGFSGGVDSSYLLYAGLQSGADIRPYYMKTAFQPEFEFEDAKRLACQLGVEITIMELPILDKDSVTENPADRCYHCKRALFGALQKRVAEDGYSILIDGTNASDDADDRPGMRALKELSVRSPLRECGLTKEDIRQRSKDAGLFTWDKPAYACLATRIPAGTRITRDMLCRVEGAETALMNMGFYDFRVRVHGDAAKLQFNQEQIEAAFEQRKQICHVIKPYFNIVLLDLMERRAF